MNRLARTLFSLVAFLLVTSPAFAEGVLLLGATGQLGARVAKSLVNAGEDVTVLDCLTSNRGRLDGLDVDYVVGDLLNEASIAAAFEGQNYRVVINTVRVPTKVADFYKISSTYISKHAKDAGVQHIIHHGAVGAGSNMNLHPDVPWARASNLLPRMMDHGAVEEIFFSSGIPTTTIRNSRVWPDNTPASGKAVMTEDRTIMTPITRIDLARLPWSAWTIPLAAARCFTTEMTA